MCHDYLMGLLFTAFGVAGSSRIFHLIMFADVAAEFVLESCFLELRQLETSSCITNPLGV